MNRKLIITKISETIVTSLFENDDIVEIHCSTLDDKDTTMLGNIYVGRVKNIVANIRAAFIEIANGVECYYDLDHNLHPIFTKKIGKKSLCIGDELLVQISKEAVKSKVPTVNSNLNFAGKYAILTSGDRRIGVSSKIGKPDRGRLQEIAQSYVSNQYGFIVRTNAKEATEVELQKEFERLVDQYKSLVETASTRTCFSCLRHAPKEYLSTLRNIYQDGLTDIMVEDNEIYEEVKEYLEREQPEDLDKLRLYQDKLLPLHKLYGIETQLSHALKSRVWMKSGAYLVIEPTETLTVIDVNTGKCVSKKNDDEAYLKINLEAAKEAAKQIRLRNLSGIILIDFINLSKQEYMDELLTFLQRELQKDPITTSFIDVTKLQLVEVTRKKVRKPLHEIMEEQR